MNRLPILIVDDDPMITSVLTIVLQERGYPIASARNGQDALNWVAHEHPGLILLDLSMPVMDGWAFASRCAELGLTFPIIVMTGILSRESGRDKIEGMAYLAKPFALSDLFTLVETLYRPNPEGDVLTKV